MNLTIVDYNSGNISSVINSFKEVAKDKVNIEVTSDLNKIKYSDKVVLPGQGSFKSCVDALNNINGLVDALNEFVINPASFEAILSVTTLMNSLLNSKLTFLSFIFFTIVIKFTYNLVGTINTKLK